MGYDIWTGEAKHQVKDRYGIILGMSGTEKVSLDNWCLKVFYNVGQLLRSQKTAFGNNIRWSVPELCSRGNS